MVGGDAVGDGDDGKPTVSKQDLCMCTQKKNNAATLFHLDSETIA